MKGTGYQNAQKFKKINTRKFAKKIRSDENEKMKK